MTNRKISAVEAKQITDGLFARVAALEAVLRECQRARKSTDPDEQERLGALAEALRFDRVMIVAGVVGL